MRLSRGVEIDTSSLYTPVMYTMTGCLDASLQTSTKLYDPTRPLYYHHLHSKSTLKSRNPHPQHENHSRGKKEEEEKNHGTSRRHTCPLAGRFQNGRTVLVIRFLFPYLPESLIFNSKKMRKSSGKRKHDTRHLYLKLDLYGVSSFVFRSLALEKFWTFGYGT